MVILSCSKKFHAFNLAEELQSHNLLSGFYTSYAYSKNTFFRHFGGRKDLEQISNTKIQTNILLAIGMKSWYKPFYWNSLFDQWVAKQIKQRKDYNVFIGWSGMSLESIRIANTKKCTTIVERGSCHILFQNQILQEEYKKRGLSFQINPKVIEKELKEYQEADYISIPTHFVKETFIDQGISAQKLLVNPYGASSLFVSTEKIKKKDSVFRVLYLGTLSIQKGAFYLLEAIQIILRRNLNIEFWFIGKIDKEVSQLTQKINNPAYRFWGFIPQHELPQYIQQCDLGIQPSLHEGLSMVIPQMMRCGLPVIATPNTGAEDIIKHNKNGYIIPTGNVESIVDSIMQLYEDPKLLKMFNKELTHLEGKQYNWKNYGNRYAKSIEYIVNIHKH